MKKYFLIVYIVAFAWSLFAQSNKSVFVAERDITVNKKEPQRLIYAMQKGDKVILTLTTNKNKEVDNVTIKVGENQIFTQSNFIPVKPIEVIIPETNFVNFYFSGTNLGRDISLKIERVPANEQNMFFNTAIQQYKKYDTLQIPYEMDSVMGYKPVENIPKTFKVLQNVDYVPVKIDSINIRITADKTYGYYITKPATKITEPYKDSKFVGYKIYIKSGAIEDKMWKYIASGIDMGSLALSLAMPVAGAAGGLAINTAFSMVAPQKNGEPIYYSIMDNTADLNKFKNKKEFLQRESGLATAYSVTWPPSIDTLAIGLRNLNIATNLNVVVVIFAIYQTTFYKDVTENVAILRPNTIKVKKRREVIENKKIFNLQN